MNKVKVRFGSPSNKILVPLISLVLGILVYFVSSNWILALFFFIFMILGLIVGEGSIFEVHDNYLVMRSNILSKKWKVYFEEIHIIDIQPVWTANLYCLLEIRFKKNNEMHSVEYGLQEKNPNWTLALDALNSSKRVVISNTARKFFNLK